MPVGPNSLQDTLHIFQLLNGQSNSAALLQPYGIWNLQVSLVCINPKLPDVYNLVLRPSTAFLTEENNGKKLFFVQSLEALLVNTWEIKGLAVSKAKSSLAYFLQMYRKGSNSQQRSNSSLKRWEASRTGNGNHCIFSYGCLVVKENIKESKGISDNMRVCYSWRISRSVRKPL